MEPVRTCVGCRERASRSALIRVVARNGELVLDERAVMSGRGAWLHPARECMDAALRRRAFARALRASGPLEFSEADVRIIEQYRQRNKG
ncbi:YlxR family protein [Microbacterium sp. KUDC0406]|uniref:YlxR family protein n=1 Tax=Microbacterium sp. KUDC0406 TaxID=2909588 RepID=UPI001F48301A|nr:YlxR family protein [Microbacterium sp. KUDC0406]UJP11340.1 YlxR family protein [Microbacterium sp. KUDC0406]